MASVGETWGVTDVELRGWKKGSKKAPEGKRIIMALTQSMWVQPGAGKVENGWGRRVGGL